MQALRVPPHSTEGEQAVLGSLLTDNRAFEAVAEKLQPDDFYTEDHRAIFRAIGALVMEHKPADIITVFDRLAAQKMADKVGGLPYLNELANCVATASNAGTYAGIVAHCAMRRRLIGLGNDIVSAGYAHTASAADLNVLIDAAAQQLADIAQGRLDSVPQLIGDLLPQWIDDLQERATGKSDAISLGLSGVDRVLAGGGRRGDLIVVGARPSMGKSAFTLGVMRAVSKVAPVLVCSLEDSSNMLIARQVASTGRTNLEHVRVPHRAPDSLWTAVADATEVLQALPIYIDDRAGLSLAQVVQKAKYVKRRGGDLALVVVDYLQLMEDEGETRSNELARIARGLKNMGKRMNCMVLLLSQLSREADKTNAPPRLDHLAESGAIEQAADIIALLWREARRNPKPDNQHKAQVEFAKNKNGACDTVQLWFDGRTQRFEDAFHGEDHGG